MTLAELFETYESTLRRYAGRFTRDPHRVDDLVQETFLRAMGHLPLLGLLKPYQRRAWLFRTLKNRFLDEEKAHRRQEAYLERIAHDDDTPAFPPQVHLLSPFDLVPERDREIFEKRYVLGMSSREIADDLGIPAATVRSRLHLAIRALRSRSAELA